MNSSFRNPWARDCPESFETTLDFGAAQVLQCNRWGTLLACGCRGGRIIICDTLTLRPAATLAGHSSIVSALAWSANGKYLASAAGDNFVLVWDVKQLAVVAKIETATLPMNLSFSPRNDKALLVSTAAECPAVYELDYARGTVTGKRDLPLPAEERAADLEGSKGAKTGTALALAMWDRNERRILCCSGRGMLYEVDYKKFAVRRSLELCKGYSAKTMDINRNGDSLLVTCTDRTIRYVDLDTMTEKCSRIKDDVNKTNYRKTIFSNNSRYICACTGECNILMWNKDMKMLEPLPGQPTDHVLDIVWHPTKPILFGVSTKERILVWSTSIVENWNAYAPSFKELMQNEEYIEREDEFDWKEPEEKRLKDTDIQREKHKAIFVDIYASNAPNPAHQDVRFDIFGDGEDDTDGYDDPDIVEHIPIAPISDLTIF